MITTIRGLQGHSYIVANQTLKSHKSDSHDKKALLGFILLHNHIRNSGVYNFQGCRIPIHSNLNIEFWRMKLVDYRDYRICDFLEFGWPLYRNALGVLLLS
jgi:hypothetical protein